MIKFTDTYVETVARAHMEPGEQLIGRTAGVYKPFLGFGIPWFTHNYLVLATSLRVILVDHRRGLLYDRLDKVESVPWTALDQMKVSGIFRKKLKMSFSQTRPKLTLKLPGMLFAPMPKATKHAKGLQATWQQARAALAAPQQPAALPPQAAALPSQPAALPPQAAALPSQPAALPPQAAALPAAALPQPLQQAQAAQPAFPQPPYQARN